jgi:hypothetical protein
MIDAHGPPGLGEAMSTPRSTYNDPEVILRLAEEAGIDKTKSSLVCSAIEDL